MRGKVLAKAIAKYAVEIEVIRLVFNVNKKEASELTRQNLGLELFYIKSEKVPLCDGVKFSVGDE